MVFGNLTDLEGNPNIIPDDKWTKINQFNYGQIVTEEVLSKSGTVFLQEIESIKEQKIAIEIKSGNALYILLNGEYITAHFSPDRVNSNQEIVFLPLKKGKNQLAIVFYNGFANALSYKIEALQQWTVYTQKLSSSKLNKEKQFHTLSVRDANPISNVGPLRMNNIEIKF
jgi:alpha-L-fucosidase